MFNKLNQSKIFIIAFLLSAAFLTRVQGQQYYFMFKIKNKSELDNLTQVISIDKVSGNEVYAYANERQWQQINTLDYKIIKLPNPGSLYKHKMTDLTIDQTMNWDTYPTYTSYVNMMVQYADSFSHICRLDTFGYSINGRLLLKVKML